MNPPLSPIQAARILGMSRSKVYAPAAPGGPIPCARIGRRIVFEEADLLEYKEKCRHTERRYTETRGVAVRSLSSADISPVGESELDKVFRSLGIVRRRTNSAARKAKGSTTPARRRVVAK